MASSKINNNCYRPFSFAQLQELGFEFEVHLDSSVPVWVSLTHDCDKAMQKRADWKEIKTWLISDDFQRFVFPKIFIPIAETKKGQRDIFEQASLRS